MSEAVERYAETIRINGLLDSIKKIKKNMKMGAEQAMNVPEVNDHDREILLKRL